MPLSESIPDLKDLTYAELQAWAEREGEPAYRADQLMKWMYARGEDDPLAMTDLPRSLRLRLRENVRISRLEPEQTWESEDRTRKFLFRLEDGEYIESVLLPERDHWTLCVSTQVGCAMGCAFCLTGKLGFRRNLRTGEIVNQVITARRLLEPSERLTNLVFMGMGEPLANFAHLVRALGILTAGNALAFSQKRVTVSTAGMANRIVSLGRQRSVSLAVSLNAADDETRSALMPINRRFPLSVLLSACRRFPLRKGRRITFEYILIRDVNDSETDARNLARILERPRAKINLIPFNEYPGSPFRTPDPDRVERFQQVLVRNHFTAIVRKSKGRDILAACGQLAGGRFEKS